MKTFLISISLLVLGIILGYFLNPHNYPLYNEESTIHYCGCIQDQPEYQKKVLDVSNEINDRIKETTKKFCSEQGIEAYHFDATFIPNGNGNYTIKYWCSNRSGKIAQLYPAYKKQVYTLLAPHKKVLEEAHANHFKDEESKEEN